LANSGCSHFFTATFASGASAGEGAKYAKKKRSLRAPGGLRGSFSYFEKALKVTGNPINKTLKNNV